MSSSFVILRTIASTLPAFCFGNVLWLSMLALLLPLLGLFWLGVAFGILAAVGWGYFILKAPLPTPPIVIQSAHGHLVTKRGPLEAVPHAKTEFDDPVELSQ